jgi:hypothetical protein
MLRPLISQLVVHPPPAGQPLRPEQTLRGMRRKIETNDGFFDE